MPYVITTTTPCGNCKKCDRSLTAAGTRGSVDCPHRDVTERSRAVATIGEARDVIRTERLEREGKVFVVILPEEGGTEGPLPDGTVIEVTQVSYDELRDDTPALARSLISAEDDPAIVADFNAAQED